MANERETRERQAALLLERLKKLAANGCVFGSAVRCDVAADTNNGPHGACISCVAAAALEALTAREAEQALTPDGLCIYRRCNGSTDTPHDPWCRFAVLTPGDRHAG